MSENKNMIEIHSCVVCSKLFNILTEYDADGKLVSCTVISPAGHRIPDKRYPLVTCNIHTNEEINLAYKKRQSIYAKELNLALGNK